MIEEIYVNRYSCNLLLKRDFSLPTVGFSDLREFQWVEVHCNNNIQYISLKIHTCFKDKLM